ncbi:CHRD domain-containing protein [Paraflavitalea pollutisoli]|uniref:CHRD domain-containing protein n=1 Tax=Paraflavitalea pollutisoli TaxID=3034143 RepID=UPI0023ECCAE8|nr:CHRD domain-containing protein [Paraflavitalea sp. H1-2-19X]
MIKIPIRAVLYTLCCLLLFSCQKEDEVVETAYLRKYWNETASSQFEVPVTRSNELKARCFLNLMTDHVFYYDILVDADGKEDVITGAGLYTGTPSSAGTLLVGLQPTINGRHVKGSVNLTAAQAQQLMEQPMFLNVTSAGNPAGLVRLQLDKNIDWSLDLALRGDAVVPAVTTTTTGKLVLRITTDKVLHYQFLVDGVEAGNTLTAAHLHAGAAGTNGALQYTFATAAGDFNTAKSVTGVADAILSLLKTGTGYVDVHAANQPDGLLRGQLR